MRGHPVEMETALSSPSEVEVVQVALTAHRACYFIEHLEMK